jgi:hypothetical protein
MFAMWGGLSLLVVAVVRAGVGVSNLKGQGEGCPEDSPCGAGGNAAELAIGAVGGGAKEMGRAGG